MPVYLERLDFGGRQSRDSGHANSIGRLFVGSNSVETRPERKRRALFLVCHGDQRRWFHVRTRTYAAAHPRTRHSDAARRAFLRYSGYSVLLGEGDYCGYNREQGDSNSHEQAIMSKRYSAMKRPPIACLATALATIAFATTFTRCRYFICPRDAGGPGQLNQSPPLQGHGHIAMWVNSDVRLSGVSLDLIKTGDAIDSRGWQCPIRRDRQTVGRCSTVHHS